jgi:hypothetical protein
MWTPMGRRAAVHAVLGGARRSGSSRTRAKRLRLRGDIVDGQVERRRRGLD